MQSDRCLLYTSGMVRPVLEELGNLYELTAKERYTDEMGLDPVSYTHLFYIHFTLELLPGVDLFSHLGRVRGLPYEWDFLEDILRAVQKESVGGLLYLKAVFSRLVYDFFEQGAGGDAYLDSFRGFYRQRAVLDHLETHLSAGLRIRDLADAMDMPVHQLSRSFQQDTKMGLKEYMSRQLAQRARQMLGHTDMPVWEVAEALGFTDPYYFSRFFKKYEKLSPREYRKLRF